MYYQEIIAFSLIRLDLLTILRASQKIMSVTDSIQREQQSKQTQLILTNDQKIKIIDILLHDLSDPDTNTKTPLQVSVSYEPIKKQSRNNSNNYSQILFEYNIPGNKYRNKSKNSNLLGKLEDLQRSESKQIKENKKEKDGNQQSQESSAEEVQQVLGNLKNQDNFRYFKDNIICFKCNKVGHYRAVCPQATTCLFCFSQEHEAENCPQKKVCYRCYGFGHVIANCHAKETSTRCYNCDRNHEGGCCFLISKTRDQTRKRDYYEAIYRDKDIRCARCLKYGHIDCRY